LDFVAAVYELDNRRAAVKAIVDRMGLADRVDQLTGELSGGWKQRLSPTASSSCKARRIGGEG
jgi:ABC-2 type transport system ATP-binding protein